MRIDDEFIRDYKCHSRVANHERHELHEIQGLLILTHASVPRQS